MIKKIAIKRMRTKLDTKIKWKQMLNDEIKKQNQFKKSLKTHQITIKKIKIKIDTYTNW